MLRGEYPKDREDPTEILYDSLRAETDMYTHLWYNALESWDYGTVLYFGHKRRRQYEPNFEVQFVKSLGDYATPHVPDVIFCRGNLEEYKPVLERWPMARRIYYGAGRHFVPPNRNYDLVLVDSEQQMRKVSKGMGINVQLFLKPAAPHFKMVDSEKNFDTCLVAVHPRDPRKRVHWVYDTVLKDLQVLQIGNLEGKPPKNVRIVRAESREMPGLMAQCCVGIVPSTGEDSGPRVVPEFVACGLPVIASTDVHLYDDAYKPVRASLGDFWDTVKRIIKEPPEVPLQPVTCKAAGRRLRLQIEGERNDGRRVEASGCDAPTEHDGHPERD
jgi:hypothetical protein